MRWWHGTVVTRTPQNDVTLLINDPCGDAHRDSGTAYDTVDEAWAAWDTHPDNAEPPPAVLTPHIDAALRDGAVVSGRRGFDGGAAFGLTPDPSNPGGRVAIRMQAPTLGRAIAEVEARLRAAAR